jgi:hypothetical protein
MPSEPGTDYSEVYLKAAREDFNLAMSELKSHKKGSLSYYN